MLHRRFAVIGDPVGHSLSPLMHRAAFHSAGLDYSYSAIAVPAHELESWVMTTGMYFCGFNVTVPHKQAIFSLLDDIDDTAQKIGAVNTVVRRHGRMLGFNTDADGFLNSLRIERIPVTGRRATVFGAGGAARAVVYALCKEGANVSVINRSARNAQDLAVSIGRNITLISLTDTENIAEVMNESDLIVNATSLGLGSTSDRSPVPRSVRWPRGPIAVDLVYGSKTPFQRQAAEAHCRVIDGIEMLVQQGAQAIRLWLDVDPDVAAMRAACQSVLEDIH